MNNATYLINFKRGAMIYNGYFNVDHNSNIIMKFKFNIYNVNDLSMNYIHEYMFVDNVMFIRERDNTSAVWEAQNMELYSIEETGINEYIICDNTQDIRIRSCICVDKYTRFVTKRIDDYIDINCLEMYHNKNKIYKFINNKIYFTLLLQNEVVETTWEEVFGVYPDIIEDFTIRDLSSEKNTNTSIVQYSKIVVTPVEKVPEKPRVENVAVSIPRQVTVYPNIPVKPITPLRISNAQRYHNLSLKTPPEVGIISKVENDKWCKYKKPHAKLSQLNISR
jgi:hypothetical protein